MDTRLFCPPVLVGERIVWLGSGSGLPQGGIVRWIGKLPEMGPDWTVGVELDNPLPYGGIDGTWGNRHLFTCEPKHGLLVPVTKTIKESDLIQWSKENIENNIQYGRGGNELFSKVHSGPPPPVSKPQVCTTPVAPARKLVTRAKTSEEPRPAVRRRKLQQLQLPAEDVHQPAQQPKAPKRKVKSEVNNFLPKIYEANKENSKSPVSSINDFNTIKSSSSDFHTLRSSPNDFNTIKSSSDDYNTLKSSLSDFNTLKSSFSDYNTLKSSLNDFNTLKTCTSGDYSDYQWFDAKDERQSYVGCKNILCDEPGSLNVGRQCHIIEGQQIRIVQANCCQHIEVKTPNHGAVHVERMSKFSVQTKCDLQDDDSSYEDAAATTVDGLYSDQFAQHFSERSNTDSSSRRASGFFSFLRWFKKGKDDGDDDSEEARKRVVEGLAAATVPSSPELIRSTSSSCGSIDTLFSTATVNSFAFVTPTAYRPFGSANEPEKRIAVGPDTDTYRNRLRQRDRIRELDRNLTLKKKYNLFGSETHLKSGINTPDPSPLIERKNKETVNQDVDQVILAQNSAPGSRNSTFGKKKRKAPDPPDLPKPECSLPNSLDKCRPKSNSMDNGDPVIVKRSHHRRTVSESAKDKKAGAYCHVKGKRRAPQPPFQSSTSEQQSGSSLERFCNQISSLGRKKRPAPQPPEENNKKKEVRATTQSYQERSRSTVSQLSPEEKERLIANIAKLKAHAERKSMCSPPASPSNMDLHFSPPVEQVVCNDSLKLERGVLKPNKELPKVDASTSETKAAPVSPRPWYKRSLTSKDGLGGLKRDIFKSLEKKKDRERGKNEEWMPEVGIPRVVGTSISSDGNSCSSTSSKFSIFSRLDRSEDKKKEGEKRKSQVSMLANISELDREAAEIVQKEQAREQALMAAQDARFYSYPDVPMMGMIDNGLREEGNENVEVPKRSSARELISLFNAIGNVTKVTVNTTFFSKEGSRFFSKEGNEKRFSFMGESVQRTEQKVVIGEGGFEQQETKQTKQSFTVDSKTPSVSSPTAQKRTVTAESSLSTKITGTSNLQNTASSSGVTIEEIEDDLEKSSRSRVMYEANKSRRHHSPSPSIPTIAEQSESASSVATTPASTLDPHPGSNRDSGIIPTDVAVSAMKDEASEKVGSGKSPDALQHAKRITIWSCPRCTLENPRWKITCDACGGWRPSATEEKVDATKCDEPFQRPTSPLHDVKKPATNKIQIIKMELSKRGKGIDWEEELKRYLPRDEAQKAKTDKSSEHSDNKNVKIAEISKENVVPSKDNSQKENITPVENVTADAKKEVLANKMKGTVPPVENGVAYAKKEVHANKLQAVAAPPTFIGGRTKQDKEKDMNKTTIISSNVEIAAAVNGITEEEPDVDEVRKARLAFFNQADTNHQVDNNELSSEKSVDKSVLVTKQNKTIELSGESLLNDVGAMKKQVDENEQLKLREMLKEMKNSLPKRPKRMTGKNQSVNIGNGLPSEISKEHEMTENTISKTGNDIRDSAHKHGAIKKVPQKLSKYELKNVNNITILNSDQNDTSKFKNGVVDQNEKAEAYLITTKTVYEDIKVKKNSGPKPMKVSTSVQTSSVMRKIEPNVAELGEHSKNSNRKPPSGKLSEMVPVTVEEFSTFGIKDGVLYTSLNKESRRIGTGTFELIRARDFANIEATKTSSESPTGVHVYANVPPSPSGSASPEQKSNILKDSVPGNVTQPVFPPQQSTSTSVQQPSEAAGNRKDVQQPSEAAGNRKDVHETEETAKSEKENNEQAIQCVEKKSVLSDESSRATSSFTSPDSESNRGGTHQSSRATSETSNYSVASVSSGDCSEVERLTAQLTLPKGIADFKADLQAASPEQNMNTLAINRLLRRLEAAIAGGQHNQAAVLAKDLARLKISCSVTRQRRSLDASPASIMVEMYVEDKLSHQGPIPLQVIPTMTVAQLKQKVEQEFEIPAGVQRWILGKLLASDDTKTLQDHNVSSNGCPMFLYLVAPDGEQEGEAIGASGSAEKRDATEVVAEVPGPPTPQLEQPGGWYYNDEEDRYSFCEDTESEVTDDEEEDESREHPVEENNVPAKTVKENKEIDEIDNGKEGKDEESGDEEDDDDDDEDDGDGIVGAAALVIHEKPVVLQAPLVGRPFVKQPPQFAKTVVGQQPQVVGNQEKPSSSQASPQLRRPTTPQQNRPDDSARVKPSTSQVEATRTVQTYQIHSAEKPAVAEKKSGTLKLGWKCPVCTLVNSPTRPGCAACTTERPLRYVVPVEYRANEQELQRMKQEQELDNELQQVTAEEKREEEETQHQHYLQLVNLDKTDLVPNMEPFECSICIVQYEPGEGVVLRECLHIFCRTCLANTVQFNEEAEVKCPYRDADYACNSVLQEREIKALVPADLYEQHLAKSVTQAENKIGNAFHCKTPDCRGWCIFEDNVNEFRCPVCRRTNCLTCQAIHDGMNCKQYQEQVKQESETNAEARRTKEMLEEMVVRGEAMNCPTCQVVLMKKWGCDWLRCSMCKTEICWVTRGPRWGPGGKGDTTGGCQCGVNGIKCHPRCNYCH